MITDRPRLDRRRALAALERFAELTAADRRDRATRGLVRATTDEVHGALRAQGVALRQGLVGLKGKWQDAPGTVWPGDWIPYFDAAAYVTREKMQFGLYFNILEALVMGGGHLVDDIGVPLTIAFNLEYPLAQAYAMANAAREVTRINDATKEGVNRIITAAIENGKSYSWTQRQLVEAYEFSRKRAKRIAVFEMGASFEQGKKAAAQQMASQGLVMEKSWLAVGDLKTRDSHRENQAAGWMPIDSLFPSGADIAPETPNCRCTILYRMAKNQ